MNNVWYEKCRRVFRTGACGISLPWESSMSESGRRSFPALTLICITLYCFTQLNIINHKKQFLKLIFWILICLRFVHVSNPRAHLQEEGCVYNYSVARFTRISISSLVGWRVCSILYIIHNMRKHKIVKLAVRMGSVFNWTPYTTKNIKNRTVDLRSSSRDWLVNIKKSKLKTVNSIMQYSALRHRIIW